MKLRIPYEATTKKDIPLDALGAQADPALTHAFYHIATPSEEEALELGPLDFEEFL